ncbi:unnamed protein product, partial [Didymodactylos carnosus]
KTSGALLSYNVIVGETDAQIQGEPKVYDDQNTYSGNRIQRGFCPNCGSPIYGKTPNLAGMMIIRLGLFIDQLPKPGIELFCKYRPEWQEAIEGIKEYPVIMAKSS